MPSEQKRQVASTEMPGRMTDRIEDAATWMLISASLLLVVAAIVASVVVHGHMAERVRAEAADRTSVAGTTLETAPLVPFDAGYQPRIGVEAKWIGPDGVLRTGLVPVTGGTAADTEVTVWLDRNGAVVAPPPSGVEAFTAAALAGGGVLLAGGSVLVIVWMRVKRAIDAANSRGWEREWTEIGPKWTSKY